jgi:hypothetical protein
MNQNHQSGAAFVPSRSVSSQTWLATSAESSGAK